MHEPDGVAQRLTEWARRDPRIRAVVLTSSRAIPNAPTDALSDYDVILALTDVPAFFEDRGWLETFGRVLVLYRDPLHEHRGCRVSCYVTQYESGLKIDFGLWPVNLLRAIASEPRLPDEFDAGYRVLLDKDRLTVGLEPPTYQAYLPTPPAEAEYLELVELFFHELTYAAKHLWRGDLMAAKDSLEHTAKVENLRPALEWLVEIEHGWTVKPGPYGRRLKRWLHPEVWAELENTYTGAGLQENWEALFRTIALFRKVMLEVGESLGYPYPHELHRRAVDYLQAVRDLNPAATVFSRPTG